MQIHAVNLASNNNIKKSQNNTMIYTNTLMSQTSFEGATNSNKITNFIKNKINGIKKLIFTPKPKLEELLKTYTKAEDLGNVMNTAFEINIKKGNRIAISNDAFSTEMQNILALKRNEYNSRVEELGGIENFYLSTSNDKYSFQYAFRGDKLEIRKLRSVRFLNS